MIFKWLIALTVLTLVRGYAELPLTVKHGELGTQLFVPAKVHGQPTELLLSWGFDNETLEVPHNTAKALQRLGQQQVDVQLQVESVEEWTPKGILRTILEAMTFKSNPVMQTLELALPYREGNATVASGFINLSRSPLHNIVLSKLLQKYQSGRQIFSIYLSREGSFLQLGGLDSYYTEGPTTHINCIVTEQWVFEGLSASFVHSTNGLEDTVSLGKDIEVKMNLQSKYLTLPISFVQPLIEKMNERNITCGVIGSLLTCSKMTSLQMRMRSFSIQATRNFSFILPLAHLYQATDKATEQVTFDVKFANEERIELGSSVLQHYYVSFDIERDIISVAVNSRDPSQTPYFMWAVRLFFYFIVISIIVGLLCGVPVWIKGLFILVRNANQEISLEKDQEVVPSTERQ